MKSGGNWGSLLKKKKTLLTHIMINSISVQSLSLDMAEAKWFLYGISAKIREVLTAWGSKLTLCMLRRGNLHSFSELLLRVGKALAFLQWPLLTDTKPLSISFVSQQLRCFIILIPQVRELRLREVKWVDEGHTAGERRLELWPKPRWHCGQRSVRVMEQSYMCLDTNHPPPPPPPPLPPVSSVTLGLCRIAYGILVPSPGIEPAPATLAALSLNHWTAREASGFLNVLRIYRG